MARHMRHVRAFAGVMVDAASWLLTGFYTTGNPPILSATSRGRRQLAGHESMAGTPEQ
jgi:hypothetical protein